MIEFKISDYSWPQVKEHKIVLYDDIDQMPVNRYMKFNKYLMLNDQIGSSWDDFDQNHMIRIIRLIEDKEKLLLELKNLRNLFYNLVNEVNPKLIAFGCLVASVNGESVNDLSFDGLRSLMIRLGELGLSWSEVKKKLPQYAIMS